MQNKLLTEADLAARWGVARKTLANQRCRGDGPPFIKLGRLVRYDPVQADAWAAKRQYNSTSEIAA
ncbi:MAG: DNA-binding protein [Sphingobium sp.]|nr:DNA-binding protein [Sphingobium sp.]